MKTTARLLSLCLVLAAAPVLAAPGVLLMPALAREGSVTLQGRALKEAPREGSTVLSRNLKQLVAPPWKGAKVRVSFQGVSATVTSGHDGTFEVNLRPPEGQRFPTGEHEATASLEGGVDVQARVEVMPDSMPLLVISDFDDTLALTGVTDPKALVVNGLLKDAHTHAVVPGMADFLGCFQKGTPAAFALVSGTPVQLAPRVSEFLRYHRFPAFGLYLRDLGPTTLSGYKQPLIRFLLREFPQPVVLVGDSGEADPEVYAQIREEFPGRVKAIYIRNAGRAADASRFQDMMLFKDAREAATHAAESGLADRECVARAFPAREKGMEAKSP